MAAIVADRALPARLPNGCRVLCDLRDHVQRHIYFWGAYECPEAWLFSRLCNLGDCVIDAGANVGQYSLLASTAVGTLGQVHAFEPVPSNFQRLQQHLQMNQSNNVRANLCALWDSRTTLQLSLPAEAIGNNSGSFRVGGTENGTQVSAVAVPLDDYVQEHAVRRVHLIKMDIEGAECRALSGMRRTIARDHPVLLLEVNPMALRGAGTSARELEAMLIEDFKYQAWNFHPHGAAPVVETFDTLSQQNVVCFAGDPPAALVERHSLKEALRWARSGRQ